MKSTVISVILLVLFFSTISCKKKIEEIKEQAVVDAMTDGTWTVTRFIENNTNITSGFVGWEIKYFNNNTLTVTKVGNPVVNGIWSGDASTFSFTSSFTTAAPAPLEKLPGTWLVTRAVSTNKGSYARNVGGLIDSMDLTKK